MAIKNKSKIGFRITGGKGFHFTFSNGYTVSVQFGPGNYCDNYDKSIGSDAKRCGEDGSTNAECAVWGPDSQMIKYPGWNDTVSNRSTPEEVLEVLNWAAKQEVKP